MQRKTGSIIALGVTAIVALKLFVFGLAYPLTSRLSGDPYHYLLIAESLTDFSSVLSYAGDRSIGIPFFEYLIRKILNLFSANQSVLTWVNAIGIALLITHIATSWLFSRWAKSSNFIQYELTAVCLFIFLATYPALIGHMISPLSDALSVDLIACAFMSMHVAMTSNIRYQTFLFGSMSALFFGFSILVRPGNLTGVFAALFAAIAISFLTRHSKAVVICAIALGGGLIITPSYYNCNLKYGGVCLQSPATFNVIASVQAGLRGARILWKHGSTPLIPIPILPDETMFQTFHQPCQLKTVSGIDDSSLTGCLSARPLYLPSYVVKKWIGLFDHFHFAPSLEVITPSWLRWMSRAYGSFAWIGLSLFFLTMAQATTRTCRQEIKGKLVKPIVPLALAVYSMVMLAQHTVLHTEDRYGFPLIPLCAVMLAIYCEKLIVGYRTYGFKSQAPLFLFCIVAWAIFIAQVVIWDNSKFY